jgi:hypothetical protein
MKCRKDIERIAEMRYKEAQCLLENKMWEGAYYLAGYSVELLLKARICKTLKIDNFFDFTLVQRKEFYKVFKSHDIYELALLSGMNENIILIEADPLLNIHWTLVIEWTEASRYSIEKGESEVIEFLNSLNEIKKWITGSL